MPSVGQDGTEDEFGENKCMVLALGEQPEGGHPRGKSYKATFPHLVCGVCVFAVVATAWILLWVVRLIIKPEPLGAAVPVQKIPG